MKRGLGARSSRAAPCWAPAASAARDRGSGLAATASWAAACAWWRPCRPGLSM